VLLNTLEKVKDVAEDLYYEVRAFYQMVRRALTWGWRLRKSYDWDPGYLLEMEVQKLKDMLYYIEIHGIHDPDCETYKPKMKSLRLAIKLGDLLLKDEYTKFYDLHTKAWGETEMAWEEILEGPSKGNYKLYWTRDKKRVEFSEQEKAELSIAWEKDARREQKHRDLFYRIIATHGQRWWD
jgi:hypothetical protein